MSGPRVLVQLINMRERATSGVVFTRQLVPRLVDELGKDNVVLLADGVAKRFLPDLACEWEMHPLVKDDRLAKNLALRRLLPASVRRHRPDVVYVPEGPLIGAPVDAPVVATLHSHLNFSRPEGMWLPRRIYWEAWANRAYRRDICRCALLIAPTAAFARELEALVPEVNGRMRVVHHGVSSAFAPGVSPPRARPAVLYVGNDMDYKNPAGAMRIFGRATEGLPHELRVVGVSPRGAARIAKRAGAEAILPRLVALGRLDEPRLLDEYRGAAALLMPSLVESFGLPALEAMATGVPVACADLPSLREVAAGAALHASPEREADFAAALRSILVDPALAARLREAGFLRARELSWERAARETATVLRDVGARHGIMAAK